MMDIILEKHFKNIAEIPSSMHVSNHPTRTSFHSFMILTLNHHSAVNGLLSSLEESKVYNLTEQGFLKSEKGFQTNLDNVKRWVFKFQY